MGSVFGKKEKDKVRVKKIFGIKFVWHTKYLWIWIATTAFWGVGRSLLNLCLDESPNVISNFVKGGILMTIAVLGAGLWEGNPEFFEGQRRGKSGKEK
jgi:hypothetical protein